jgi:hypothetical protein
VTEQPASTAVTGDTGARGLDAHIGESHGHEAHHGRPVSWVVVTIIVIGFVVGGIALCIGPSWVTFWIGAAIVVVGGIVGAATHIMEDWY